MYREGVSRFILSFFKVYRNRKIITLLHSDLVKYELTDVLLVSIVKWLGSHTVSHLKLFQLDISPGYAEAYTE